MPNFSYIAVSGAYHLALALWIGGAVALGALAAPELFRRLPREDAGSIFGSVLRRFARLRLAAVTIALAAAATKRVVWENHASSIWIALRWLALAYLTIVVVYEIYALEPAMARWRGAMGDSPADPARIAFMRLHKRSEMLMKTALMAALAALLLG